MSSSGWLRAGLFTLAAGGVASLVYWHKLKQQHKQQQQQQQHENEELESEESKIAADLQNREPNANKKYIPWAFGGRPLNIGHRGFGANVANIPENTMASFKLAVEKLDGLETDVRITKDNHFVLLHDRELLGKHVDDYTLEEILRVNLGHGQGVATLRELMDLIPEPQLRAQEKHARPKKTPFHLILELKDAKFKQYEFIHRLLDYLKNTDLIHKVAMLSCFNHEALVHAHRYMQDYGITHIELAPLFNRDGAEYPPNFWEGFSFPVAEIHGSSLRTTSEIVKQTHQAGFRSLVWMTTLASETKDDMIRFIDMGVDTLITNKPDLLEQIIAEKFPI